MSGDRQDPSRRSFLLTLGGAAAASLAKTPFANAQSPRISNPPSIAPTLAQSDIQYLGLFKVPGNTPAARFGFSQGAMTARTVGGNLQFLMTGAQPNSDPVYEISYPGYGSNIATAPVASLINAWGDVYQGKKLIYRTPASGSYPNVRGLLWYNNQLYWTYGDSYNASSTSWDPSVGLSVLNSDGTVAAYGPWRTGVPSQLTRGYMMPIPSWFSSAYVSGMGLSIGAPITSGNVGSPWGAAAHACTPPTPGMSPDPVQSGTTYAGERASIATHRMILHDIAHAQARDANYRNCGWNVKYDCSQGSVVTPGVPFFQQVDTMSSAAWIDLPTKRGVVFFGQLATKVDGFNYGSDNLPHIWYGAGICCHGQNGSPFWMATGPGTPTSVPYVWIYDPNDLALVAQGKLPHYGVTPKAVFPISAISSAFPSQTPIYYWGGAHFDPASQLLFVSTINDDVVTESIEPRPVVRVFHIKS